MSTIYKERDRERDVSRTSYTKYKTYRLPDRDDDNVSVVKERDVVVRREREPSITRQVERYRVEREVKEPRRDIEYRVIEREEEHPHREVEIVKRETRVEQSPAGRDYKYERELVRAPSPHSEHASYRDVRELDRPRARDWDLERYVRSVEYAQQPIIIQQQPQQIIIREVAREPIVIERERPRYDVRDEERQMVRREEPKHRDDEDYYYERRTREVDRGPRRDGGGEHFEEREHRRHREHDSVSRHDDHSDEGSTHVYRRKEIITERDRSASPHHKRHLLEGAALGAGAAEIIRHHRKAQGEDAGHRGRNLAGSAALGAVGAEVLSRVHRARSRRGSRSRSRSWSRSSDEDYHHRGRHRKHRSRSRSRSKSRVRQIGSVAAVAAVGALAGYALRNRNKQPQVIERRSRSRIRRASLEREGLMEQRSFSASPPRKSSEHNNRRIAQAGLASAAAAGLWQRMRSRSRKGKSRERSRLREGIPIAAAGLGGAAAAGLYERSKAKKNARMDGERERDFSRSRSPSRSRGHGPYPDEPGVRHVASDPALIEYGDEPIYTERPGEYRRRHRGTSSDSSPDRRRRSRPRERSRSRAAGFTEAAAVAGIAGAAAHELTKRNERKKEERRRRREEDERYAEENPPYTPPPMGSNAEYTPQAEFYPQTQNFPPPPTNEFTPTHEYPPYNPADYPPPPGAPPAAVHSEPYPPSPAPPAAGYVPNETFLGDNRYAEHNPAEASRRAAENVSPAPAAPPADEAQDGLDPPRGKSVAFAHDGHRRRRRHSVSDSDLPSERERGYERERERNPDRRRRSTISSRRPQSPSSESTEDLPARFDEQGRRMPDRGRGQEDVFADKLADILAGKGTVGGLFRRLTGDFFLEGQRERERRR